MRTLPPETVAEAFALSNSRGAELLARLGHFNVWRGDLATMRGDNPQAARSQESTPTPSVDGLLLVRAIELLPPSCRAALSAAYAEQGKPQDGQRIASCEKQLLDIYDSLAAAGSRSR
jgi:hypothetical protein